MTGHNICFNGEIGLIIPRLSFLTLHIRSTEIFYNLKKVMLVFSNLSRT